MPVSTEFLKRVSWFEDLDQKSLDAIANAAVEQRYQPGQEIVRQGDTGVGAFIIRSGKVDIVQDKNGTEVKLATLGPGDVFGEMALLDEFPRSASARAVEPTTALGIQRWHFRGILESHPQIALALLPILTRRIVTPKLSTPRSPLGTSSRSSAKLRSSTSTCPSHRRLSLPARG